MSKVIWSFIVIALASAILVFGQNPSAPNIIALDGNLLCCQNKTVGLGSFGAGSDAWLSNVYFDGSNYEYIGNGRGASVEDSFGTLKIRLFANNTLGAGASASAVTVASFAQGAPINSFVVGATGGITFSQLKSATGTRFLCVDTAGNVTASAAACSGT